jgi:hypothetical protein
LLFLKEKDTMKQHPRRFQLLAQYAIEYIGQMLDHDWPPCNLADMTIYRLDSPRVLAEVIEGVLGDKRFQDQWQSWQYRLKQVREEPEPCWIAGQSAYAQFRQDHQERDGQLLSDRGVELARAAFDGNSQQMWFYEGWLSAMQEDGVEV